jgi:hypothetical protein
MVKIKIRKTRRLRYAIAKSQSAMEYLMTYGWAILIIAVVLGALFQLGVFNANNFAPKAPPGACQVFRPNGPGTTSFINLEGECQGELPEYVAQSMLGDETVYIGNAPNVQANSITMVAWIKVYSYPTTEGWQNILEKIGPTWASGDVEYGMGLQMYSTSYPNQNAFEVWGCNANIDIFPYTAPLNEWVQVAGTIYPSPTNPTNSVTIAYVDGAQLSNSSLGEDLNNLPCSGALPLYIDNGGSFDGAIANAQIYNTSLSANEIQALYQEGIGGAPIDLQNLVGWWPLNGNANDYSGNNYNGNAINVTYTTGWYNGYSAP